jgi:hypothetical protein
VLEAVGIGLKRLHDLVHIVAIIDAVPAGKHVELDPELRAAAVVPLEWLMLVAQITSQRGSTPETSRVGYATT